MRALRWANVVQQVLCVGTSMWMIAFGSVVVAESWWLGAMVVLSTMVEMGQWAGHMWAWKRGRTLPLWCIWGDNVASMLERHSWTLGLSSLLAVASLCGALVLGGDSWFVVAGTFLLLAASLDIWRLLYIHYWILALFALADGSLVAFDLSLIVGFLYLFAGWAKVVSREFYQSVAPDVFGPIFSALRIPETSSGLRRGLSFLGVLGEAFLGVGILFASVMAPSLRLAVAIGVVGLHAYIMVMIGWRRGVHTFISWNAFCMCISVYVLLEPRLVPGVSPTGFSIFCAMVIPPLFKEVRTEFPTLAHAYFVPRGFSFGLVAPVRCVPLNACAFTSGSTMHAELVKDPALCVVTGEWVDQTFMYNDPADDFDECNEYFAPGRFFWTMVIRRTMHGTPGCKIITIT